MTNDAAVIMELLKRATRAETPVIENVALAAGFLWRCPSRYCGVANPDGHGLCSRCGMARPIKQRP